MIKLFIQEFILNNTDFSSFIEKFLSKNNIDSSESESITNVSFDDIFLQGTYFKKIIHKEPTNNPFVEKPYIEYEYFTNQQFYLIKNELRSFLVVINPTKHTKFFYSYLDELSGLNLILKDKSIDINDVINQNITQNIDKVLRAKFCSVSLSETSRATIEISSSSNAINDFIDTFGKIYYEISKAKIVISNDKYSNLDLEISKTGLIQISKFNSVNLIDIKKIIEILYI